MYKYVISFMAGDLIPAGSYTFEKESMLTYDDIIDFQNEVIEFCNKSVKKEDKITDSDVVILNLLKFKDGVLF